MSAEPAPAVVDHGLNHEIIVIDDEDEPVEVPTASTEHLATAVIVAYKHLPHDSKVYLEDLLAHWANEHLKRYPQGYNETQSIYDGSFELQTSFLYSQTPNVVWHESKLSAVREAVSSEHGFNERYEELHAPPLYDRATSFHLTPTSAKRSAEDVGTEGTLSAPPPAKRSRHQDKRCWNCNSYNHESRACPKPKDFATFDANRRAFQEQSVPPPPPFKRYFVEEVQGEGDKQGVSSELSQETRAALGLSDGAPPPWLGKMIVMGTPPDFSTSPDAVDQEPILKIFDDGPEAQGGDVDGDQAGGGDAQPGEASVSKSRGSWLGTAGPEDCSVTFPGFNSPAPDGPEAAEWQHLTAAATQLRDKLAAQHTATGSINLPALSNNTPQSTSTPPGQRMNDRSHPWSPASPGFTFSATPTPPTATPSLLSRHSSASFLTPSPPPITAAAPGSTDRLHYHPQFASPTPYLHADPRVPHNLVPQARSCPPALNARLEHQYSTHSPTPLSTQMHIPTQQPHYAQQHPQQQGLTAAAQLASPHYQYTPNSMQHSYPHANTQYHQPPPPVVLTQYPSPSTAGQLPGALPGNPVYAMQFPHQYQQQQH